MPQNSASSSDRGRESERGSKGQVPDDSVQSLRPPGLAEPAGDAGFLAVRDKATLQGVAFQMVVSFADSLYEQDPAASFDVKALSLELAEWLQKIDAEVKSAILEYYGGEDTLISTVSEGLKRQQSDERKMQEKLLPKVKKPAKPRNR